LSKKRKYDVFLDGKQSEIRIRTTCDNQDRLLVIKNDYANCFVPFLASYYREIVVIDPVYYNGDLSSLIEEEKITDVLFLYDMNGFMKDDSIYTVLNGVGTVTDSDSAVNDSDSTATNSDSAANDSDSTATDSIAVTDETGTEENEE
jgi:hypothetical protein